MGGCDCSKPKPGPNGNQKPAPAAKSLVASAGSTGAYIHVSPSGKRTQHGDLLGARAAVARDGGSIDLG